MKNKDHQYYKLILNIKKYTNIIQLFINTVNTIVLGIYINSINDFSIEGFKNSKIFFLVLSAIIFLLQTFIIRLPSNLLKRNKTQIINNFLASYQMLLFSNFDMNKFQLCAMIQVIYKEQRRTPYYINEACNSAIRNHRDKTFGDVGQAFFGDKKHRQPYLFKTLSQNDWNKADDTYKNDVPENLRIIMAAPIYSCDPADSDEIIAVLEFDVFTKNKNDTNIDPDLIENIDTIDNQHVLTVWAKAISYLLEMI